MCVENSQKRLWFLEYPEFSWPHNFITENLVGFTRCHTLGNVDQEPALKFSYSIICSSICHELDAIFTSEAEKEENQAESDIKHRTRGRLIYGSVTLT